MSIKNYGGLWMSSFTVDVAANIPTTYPGEGNLAAFYATDTQTLYVAANPLLTGVALAWKTIGGGTYVAVPDAATYTVTAADSGKTFIFPNETANVLVTLPATPTLGLTYTFVGSAGAADAQSWAIQCGASGLLIGGVLGMDTDAGAGSDELVPVYANGTSHVKLTMATPDAGTRLAFYGNGTNWIITGQVASAAAPVFA